MSNELIQLVTTWAIPLGVVAASLLLGYSVERVAVVRLHTAAIRREWRWGNVLVTSLRGLMTIGFLTVGVWLATLGVELRPRIENAVELGTTAVVMALGTVFLARFLVGVVRLYAQRTEALVTATTLIGNVTRLTVYVVGSLVMLQTFGVSITPILTALGVGGLAVALALQDTLSNLFAGLHILATGQIKPGNYIRLETGEEGYVTDITWRNTSVHSILNWMTIIPNSKLASTIVRNYYLPQRDMAVLVAVGVNYRSDLAKVERVTIEVAREVLREVPGSVPWFEPFIRFNSFGEYRVQFNVILRVKEVVDQHIVAHEFIKRLHSRYRHEGIEIPEPVRIVRTMDGVGASYGGD
jgi:small-conductance mechanosensitive channel